MEKRNLLLFISILYQHVLKDIVVAEVSKSFVFEKNFDANIYFKKEIIKNEITYK